MATSRFYSSFHSVSDPALIYLGNSIPKSCELPDNRYSLQNRYCQVYWPLDDLTRVCHVLSYDEKTDCYQVFYFFDGLLYDEYFDSDWSLIEIPIDDFKEPGSNSTTHSDEGI